MGSIYPTHPTPYCPSLIFDGGGACEFVCTVEEIKVQNTAITSSSAVDHNCNNEQNLTKMTTTTSNGLLTRGLRNVSKFSNHNSRT